jgi:hypothetical protein
MTRKVNIIYSDQIMTGDWMALVALAFPNHFRYHHGMMTAYGDHAQCKSIMRHLVKPKRFRSGAEKRARISPEIGLAVSGEMT